MKESSVNILMCLSVLLLLGCTNKAAPPPNDYFRAKIPVTPSSERGNYNQISEIIELSVQRILHSYSRITADTTVAVADFVSLAANYDRSPMLGRYLGQAFITALHNAGVFTVDYQVTGTIRVTPEGNLALTQDYLELPNEVDANSVLVGTITSTSRGYIIHVRMVDNVSKHVIGADQFFLSKQEVNDSVRVSL